MGVKDLRTGTNCNLLYLANKSWGAISTLKSCEKRRVGGGQQMQIHCQHFPFQSSPVRRCHRPVGSSRCVDAVFLWYLRGGQTELHSKKTILCFIRRVSPYL